MQANSTAKMASAFRECGLVMAMTTVVTILMKIQTIALSTHVRQTNSDATTVDAFSSRGSATTKTTAKMVQMSSTANIRPVPTGNLHA